MFDINTHKRATSRKDPWMEKRTTERESALATGLIPEEKKVSSDLKSGVKKLVKPVLAG